MLQRKLLLRALSVLLSATLCFPAFAAEAVATKLKSNPRTAVELQMQADGVIRGKVVNRQGKSLTNARVNVVSKDGRAVALTDANGMFAVQGVSVGEYMIGIGKRTQKVRVWNAQTAPPNTAQLALLVVGDTVRGQCCGEASCDSCAAPAPTCGAPAADCCAAAAPTCGAPAADCCAPAAPTCGAPAADCCAAAAPTCGAPAADCCEAGPTCGVPSPVACPCDSILPSCGSSCGGCDSCGGGHGCGLFGGGAGGAGSLFGAGAAPVVIGGAVAAAIAIPLALDDDDDAS